MLGFETARWTLQRAPTEFVHQGECRILRRRDPFVLVLIDVRTNLVRHPRLGHPESNSDEAATRLEVHIKPRSVGILCPFVAKMHAGIELVRRLVLGESRVAMDPKERSSDSPRVRDEVRREFLERFDKVGDEVECGLAHRRLVAGLVLVEPGSVIVDGQVTEKGE